MAVDWIAKRDMAAEKIAKYGQSVTMERPGVPGGTPYAPTPGVPTQYQITVIDLGLVAETQPGTLVPMVQRTLLASVGTAPRPVASDKIQIGGVWHEVDRADALSPAGTDLIYTIKLVG